jgi:hypothetical protein
MSRRLALAAGVELVQNKSTFGLDDASEPVENALASDTHVAFEEWTKGRQPAVLGTNSGTTPLAFQNWRRFKEAFAPELVERAIAETSIALGRAVRTCLDPCAGSGTTPLACQFLGVYPVAIEVNPYLADLIEAKLTVVDVEVAARRLGEVLALAGVIDPTKTYPRAAPTFIEPGKNGRYLFSADIAARMAALLSTIQTIREEPIRRLFRVLLGSAILEVCNATVSGKGRRYRRHWETLRFTKNDLDRAFQTAVEAAIYDIARYASRKTLDYQLRRGDARILMAEAPLIDVAVFSPPYPNSFDYTDVYNIELWALGYLCSSRDNLELRHQTLRSHVQIFRDYSAKRCSPIVAETVKTLKRTEGLWNKNIPDMIGAYFADMETLLTQVRAKLTTAGRVYMVVGDSKYAGVEVPVADALSEIAPPLGYSIECVEPFRSMRASPQQGGREELDETLIVLTAC